MEEKEEFERFDRYLTSIGVPDSFNREFLFETYRFALEGAKNMQEQNPQFPNSAVNPAQLTLYLVNEHAFYCHTHPSESAEKLEKSEDYMSFLASISLDKYFTNQHLAFRMGSFTSPYSPLMSTIDLYLNFILGMLSRYSKNDPAKTLIVDILNKGFQISKCVASLIEGGYEVEAFSTWRTLHENECILHVIVKYGKPVIEAYLRHMNYAIAFRGGIPSKEQTDAIFVQIKEEMRAHDLKSKDMKRFIEYGWLYGVEDVEKIEGFKLNFRDGVERVANLSTYAKVYEMSSEIAHSSPMLIYSKKDYFFLVALLNLYESFFRLERIFTSLYMSTVSDAEKESYRRMRELYYAELQAAYEEAKRRFAALNRTKGNAKGKDEE